MARPLRLEYEGAIYHVMARGNERGSIFELNSDRLRFIEKLGESAQTYGVRVYAYVLMKNHWHGLIETPRGNLSIFMQQFNTSYTTYYNTRHQRVGHLYSGRYKAPLIKGDDYLLRLSRYIHLNPVRSGAVTELSRDDKIRQLHAYRWSSFQAYAGRAPRLAWVDYEPLMALVAEDSPLKASAFSRFVEGGIGEHDDVLAEAMGWSSKAIGTQAFCRQVELDLKAQVGLLGVPQDAAMRRIEAGVPPETVETAVYTVCRVTRADLCGQRKKSDARAILMKLLIEYSGMTQRSVAQHLGLTDGSIVSRTIAQLNRGLTRNRQLDLLLQKAVRCIIKH